MIIAAGRIQPAEAVGVAVLLTLVGFTTLRNVVNPATAVATLATLLVYVLGYTLLKTRTSLCTTVGAIPGAMPPVLGWAATGNPLSLTTLSLFAILKTTT